VTDGPTAPIVVPGVVAEVKGRKDVRVGDPCIVLADARAGSVRPKDVTVRCGDRELYRLSDLTGDVTSKWTWDLRPQTHAGVSRYALAWEDVGSRSGSRPEARIDSYQRKATLWKTGAYSVVLLLAPLSFPDGGHVIKGSSQPVEPVGVAPMRVSLSVSAVEGDTALAVGNSCALEIWQLVSEIKCRALLSCGPRVLYGDGGGGFLRCAR
jgi:hypothetical protein